MISQDTMPDDSSEQTAQQLLETHLRRNLPNSRLARFLSRPAIRKLSRLSHQYFAQYLPAPTVEPVTFSFPNLPQDLDGFRILQISDPHFYGDKRAAERLAQAVNGTEADQVVLTGDYSLLHYDKEQSQQAAQWLGRVVLPRVKTDRRPIAIAGNHDSLAMRQDFESEDITVLIDQAVKIECGKSTISIVGTDDPHSRWSAASEEILKQAPAADFKLALMHSPSKADIAAQAGFDLCLSGHTHAGIIRLGKFNLIPEYFGIAPERIWGAWSAEKMQGYTVSGVGTSLLPIRINAPAQIALITLKKG